MATYSTPRREARFPLSADVLAVDVATGLRREGAADNISRGGCYVRMTDPFLAWTKLKLWVVYHRQQFEAEGSVVHSRGGYGMGISFEKIPAESQEILGDWLRELGG